LFHSVLVQVLILFHIHTRAFITAPAFVLYIISQSQLHLCCWWCNFSVLTRSFSYFSCSLHCVHRDFQDLWSV